MTTLTKLYNIVSNENIGLFNYPWKSSKAKIVKYKDDISIGMNYSQIENEIEEKEILAEELGHYYCNAIYNYLASPIIKRKCELRAMKWAYSILVPYKKLKLKIKEGLNVYELADEFDVDVKYMIDCVDFYVEKYGEFN